MLSPIFFLYMLLSLSPPLSLQLGYWFYPPSLSIYTYREREREKTVNIRFNISILLKILHFFCCFFLLCLSLSSFYGFSFLSLFLSFSLSLSLSFVLSPYNSKCFISSCYLLPLTIVPPLLLHNFFSLSSLYFLLSLSHFSVIYSLSSL